ncbi:MAG: hypothetical protein H0V20_00540 [Actinobacteria bacterium]|nr:hypothetical protein [Actinomycetota bacterium]
MTALQAYRDDGPLAGWIGKRARGAVPVDELLLTVIAAIPLAAVLATAEDRAPTYAIGAAVLIFVLIAGSACNSEARPLVWAVPPLLRAVEYSFLVALTALSDPDAMPFCFAFLGVLALHHYDTVYRLRHQHVAPPAWVGTAGGGWEGRMIAASILAATDFLGAGLVVVAATLALVYGLESTTSWLRFGRERHAAPDEAVGEGEDVLAE